MKARHVGFAALLLSLPACIYAPQSPGDHHDASPHKRSTPRPTAPGPNPSPPPISRPPPTDPGEEEPPTSEADGRLIELRLRGADVADYSQILVMVDAVEVLIDGRPARFELREEVINLAQVTHAWKVGTFRLPETARDVLIVMRLGPTAGTIAGSGPGAIDLRASPMRFHSPAGHLRFNQHAVVHLSVEHSLVSTGAHPLLLPHFSVQY